MWLYVAMGGGVGSLLRYWLMGVVGSRLGSGFPYSTLAVNILGSLAMGLLVGALAKYLPAHQAQIRSFVAVGVLGGFTTFSTFSLDIAALIERGQWQVAYVYALLCVVMCVTAVFLGLGAFR